MTRNQVLRMIELPLSLSVIIGGIRIALVVAIGVVAIGSFIGAPTLGDIVIRGTNATDGTLYILAGAIPIVIIVVLIDVILRLLEKSWTLQINISGGTRLWHFYNLIIYLKRLEHTIL